MSLKDKKNYTKIEGVSSRIAKAILETGMSQVEIARKMKMYPTAISRWKTGQTEPTPANINSLSKILKVDVNWLMTGEGSQTIIINEATTEIDDTMYREKFELAQQRIIELLDRCSALEKQVRQVLETQSHHLARKKADGN